MIVTCPSCQTRYRIDPATLGEKGRSVRCASCGNRWFVEPFTRAAETVPTPAAPPRPRPVAVPDPAAEDRHDGDALRDTPLAGPPPLVARGEAKPARGGLAGWLLVALVALLLVAAVVGRNEIAAAFPPAVPVYQRLGLPVMLRLGLEFRALASERRAEGGGDALVVSGEVHNVSGQDRQVPQLRVALLDAARGEISSSLFDAPQKLLPPDGSTRFEIRLPSPPEAAKDFSITFVDTP